MTALTERRRPAIQHDLSRGHLSRPACSHVKQVAKRPGTRVSPAADVFPAGFFVGHQGGHDDVTRPTQDDQATAPKPSSCMAAPCARSSARRRRRCSSPRASSTTAPSSARRASRARSPASSIRASPTRPSTMFEQRMAALEGAEAARATATGMAAVTTALLGQVKAGDHVVAAQGAVRLLPLRGRGPAAALRHRLDAGRRHRSRRSGEARCGRTPRSSSSKARPIRRSKCSTSRRSPRSRTRPARRSSSTMCSRRRSCRSPLEARRRLRRLFRDQAHRRPGPLPRRRHPRLARSSSQDHIHNFIRQTGPSLSPFNAWVMLKGLETLPLRVQRQTESAATVADVLAEHPKVTRLIYPGRPIIRRPTSCAGR